MLSIGKLGRGAEGYYLQVVARGVEDYYLGSGEAAGRWLGAGADRLGLSGNVRAEDLRTVLDGRHPDTGRSLLWFRRHDRLPGFDLTFSAPKGVSLLFALAEERTSLLVREAHDRAVAAALRYLEREAGEVRRGRDGVDRLPGGGFVAAAFRHRSSRAGDPQLHTHVLVANMTRGSDGRWSALDGRQLYWQAKTAGTLYQAALRYELRALGLRFVLRDTGLCELADVPRRVLRGFSRRRAEIESELARRGESSPAAAQVATLATRKSKDYGVPPASLANTWHARADELGFDAAARARVFGRTTPTPPSREVVDQAATLLLGQRGLTEKAAVFDRRDAVRAWCGQLPGGAPVHAMERLADNLLDNPEVVPLEHHTGCEPGAARSFARHTTRDMLAVEQQVHGAALGSRNTGRCVVDHDTVDHELGDPAAMLSAEQAAMVRQLTTVGNGVDVVVGKAGTGKTYALAAAHRCWQRSGVPVLGTAVAARAALALAEGAGIPAMSVARLLALTQRARLAGLPGVLPAGAVLVVDEAGMLGTRQLTQLLEASTGAGGKLVLVGDHRQLPELVAGGTFQALARDLPAVTLTDNRRQTHAWERAALDQLRAGDVASGLAAYADAGRVVTLDGADAQRAAIVARWWDATRAGNPAETVMLAHRRADVDDLNRRARDLLLTTDTLPGPDVYGVDQQENPRCFAVGDQVIVRRNDHHHGLVNGQRGHVTAVDPHTGNLRITAAGRGLTVTRAHLMAGALDHGYALTVHQAQGLTLDRALLLGSTGLYREAGYVGLSRARDRTDLILSEQADDLAHSDDIDRPPPAAAAEPALEAINRALARSRAQRTAHDIAR
jgi:conjugative relaxase-like TrwC/TraI family protein